MSCWTTFTTLTPRKWRLLTQLASYARQSRWLVTSRMDLDVEGLAGQTLMLNVLREPELAALALAWAPDAAAARVAQAVSSAGGSPWFLRQALFGASTKADWLEGLPQAARQFLTTVAVAQLVLPLQTLLRFAVDPGPEGLAALEQRGLGVETSGCGFTGNVGDRVNTLSCADSRR